MLPYYYFGEHCVIVFISCSLSRSHFIEKQQPKDQKHSYYKARRFVMLSNFSMNKVDY